MNLLRRSVRGTRKRFVLEHRLTQLNVNKLPTRTMLLALQTDSRTPASEAANYVTVKTVALHLHAMGYHLPTRTNEYKTRVSQCQ